MENTIGQVDYSRQAAFNQLFASHHNFLQPGTAHVIIGCGGVGFWLGLILAMQGMTRFVLMDGQGIELSNLNRLPVPPHWVGVNKAIALRKIIRQLRPTCVISTITRHYDPQMPELLVTLTEMLKQNSDVTVWDCTDNAHTQKEIFKKFSGTRYLKYRKIGYEGFKVGTYVDYNVWTVDGYAPGYRTSNACAATSALAAVVGFMAHGFNIEEDINIDLKKVLGVPEPEDVVFSEDDAEEDVDLVELANETTTE